MKSYKEFTVEAKMLDALTKYFEKDKNDIFSEYGVEYVVGVIDDITKKNSSKKDVKLLADLVLKKIKKENK